MSDGPGPSLRHRVEFALVRGARLLDRVLGERRTAALAAGLGRVAYRTVRIRRGVVEDQLRLAFPDRDTAWIRRTASDAYAHLAREGLSMLRLSRLGPEEVIAATEVEEGLPALRQAVRDGTGAVVITGHFGNWEIGGAAVAARGVPLDVVVRRQANPLFDRLINEARERLGMRVIERSRATREVLRSLRAGRVVALVADQDARRAGVFVPFFGRPASTVRGPAVLALRSGAPVFMGTAERRPDGGYRVRVRRIPTPSAADPEEQVRALTAAHAAALEAAVRENPGQYLWHHRRWKTDLPRAVPRADPATGGGERGPDDAV